MMSNKKSKFVDSLSDDSEQAESTNEEQVNDAKNSTRKLIILKSELKAQLAKDGRVR